MISIFALGSDLPEIEVIRSALSEERKFSFTQALLQVISSYMS